MKLHHERSNVERSGVNAETAFQIKTTAKAFDILSSGLYTDNILAIVRELSCNAYDAHVAAGTEDKPFEIHLPNDLEPWFHVKDFGIGLSDDQVMGLYTTYFDSTKTDSNDYIGALGLGSKSPFSYTNAFEVVARHDGMSRTYSVFINEDGVPTIAKLGEVATDDHPGLEVKITVKSNDYHRFEEKTAKALKWFPVKPEVIGVHRFNFDEVQDHRLKGTGWHLLPRDYSDPKMTAVQGNVAYAVNLDQIELDHETRSLLDRTHLVAMFEIGDLEVAASREEIRYDDRSKQALLAVIDNFRAEVKDQIEAQIKGFSKKYWYAFIELNDMSSKLFGSESALRKFFENEDVKNKTLKRYIADGGSIEIPRLNGYQLYDYHASGRYGRNAKLSRSHVGQNIAPRGNMEFMYNDMKVGGVSRMQEYLRQADATSNLITIVKKKDAEYLVEDDNGDMIPTRMTEDDYAKEFKELIKAVGNPKVKTVSTDTPRPPRGTATVDRTLPIFSWGGLDEKSYGRYGWNTKYKATWDRVDFSEFDIDNGGLYFTLRNGSNIVVTNGEEVEKVGWADKEIQGNFQRMIDLINKHNDDFDFTMDDLYAMGALATNKVVKMENWFNIFDLVRAIVPLYVDPILYFKNKRATSDDLDVKRYLMNKKFMDKVRELDADSTFRKAIEPLAADQKKYADDEVIAKFLEEFDEEFGARLFTDVQRTPYFTAGVFDEYPMLSFVGSIELESSYRKTDIGVLFDYIKMIDRS